VTIRIFLSLALLALAGSVAAEPQMTVGENSFDFGYAPQNNRVAHVFWLRSTGVDTLRITKVQPGCGCTKAPLEKDVLAPGDSTRLEVIFNTGKYKGNIMKSPKIYTNVSQEAIPVIIRAHILSAPDSAFPITVTPSAVELTPGTVGTPIELTIHNVSDNDLNLHAIDLPADVMALKLPSKVAAGADVTALLTVGKGAPVGFIKSFTFAVGDDGATHYTVPVQVMQAGGPERVEVSR
jgi:hypothetical protein